MHMKTTLQLITLAAFFLCPAVKTKRRGICLIRLLARRGVGYLVTSGLTVSVTDDEEISVTTGNSEVSATGPVSKSTEAPSATSDRSAVSQADLQTRASATLVDASDDYKVTIRNDKTAEEKQYTYGDLKKAGKPENPLQPGSYTISAESPDYADYLAGTSNADWG